MKNIIAYSFILFFAGISLVSCLGDLDTMPLDDNQLVSEKVYQTKDGYTGVLAKCYASLVLTGQKGGDGGDGAAAGGRAALHGGGDGLRLSTQRLSGYGGGGAGRQTAPDPR